MGMLLAGRYERWRVAGLYLAAVAAGGALLAHFDGAWVVPPLAILAVDWWRQNRIRPDFIRLRLHAFAAGAVYAALVLGFYIEYGRRLGAYQLDYWGHRFGGTRTDSLHFFQYF